MIFSKACQAGKVDKTDNLPLATDFAKAACILIIKTQLFKEIKRTFANSLHDRMLLQAKLKATFAGYSFL